MKLASTAPTAMKRGVGERIGLQVAFDADAAADRVEAEQQHDERDVFLEDRVFENRPHEAGVERAGAGADDMMRGPVAFERRLVQERIVGERDERQPAGDDEFVAVRFPPMMRGRHQRQDRRSRRASARRGSPSTAAGLRSACAIGTASLRRLLRHGAPVGRRWLVCHTVASRRQARARRARPGATIASGTRRPEAARRGGFGHVGWHSAMRGTPVRSRSCGEVTRTKLAVECGFVHPVGPYSASLAAHCRNHARNLARNQSSRTLVWHCCRR